jgi:hypothetical protein
VLVEVFEDEINRGKGEKKKKRKRKEKGKRKKEKREGKEGALSTIKEA